MVAEACATVRCAPSSHVDLKLVSSEALATVANDIALAERICALLNSHAFQRDAADDENDDGVARKGKDCILTASLPTGVSWSRGLRDQFRRCVDRAVCRVHPGIDCRVYAHPGIYVFNDGEGTVAVHLRQEFAIVHHDRITEFTVEGIVWTLPCSSRPSEASSADIPEQQLKTMRSTRKTAQKLCQFLSCEWMQPTLPRQHISGSSNAVPVASDWNQFFLSTVLQGRAHHRLCHVEPKGLVAQCAIVAVTELYALVAVSCSFTASKWIIVGRVPLPEGVECASRKRTRESAEQTHQLLLSDFGCSSEMLTVLRGGHANVLEPANRKHISVISYRIYLTPNPTRGFATVEFDDCYAVSTAQVMLAEDQAALCNSAGDVMEMLKQCGRSGARHAAFVSNAAEEGKGSSAAKAKSAVAKKHETPSSASSSSAGVEWLKTAMSEPSKVAFKKDKSNFRATNKQLNDLNPIDSKTLVSTNSVTLHTVVHAEETSMMEFKAHLAEWRESIWGSSEQQQQAANSNRERLRHGLAAMCNSFGGYLVIGVADDGKIVGDQDDGTEVRTNGFFPPLSSGTIDVTKLRVVDSAKPARTLSSSWWKETAPQAHSSTAQSSGSAPAQERGRAVTLYRVFPGTAPYYAPGKFVCPSMRGAASTLRMPVSVCCARLERHLSCNSALTQSDLPFGRRLAGGGAEQGDEAIADGNASYATS